MRTMSGLLPLLFFITMSFSINANETYDKALKVYNNNNYAEAIILFKQAADEDDPKAMNYVGYMYEVGEGVDQDFTQASQWYQKAANLGNVTAQVNLGHLYKYGRGVQQDYNKAFEWYQKAANQGHASAQNHLGILFEMGQGVAQNLDKAFEWYQKAADQGERWAQTNLGYMYDAGLGVEQDYNIAFEWYQKAANQGHARAQTNLGVLYEKGKGVAQNLNTAFEWYQKAADQGDSTAQSNLGILYRDGTGVQQSDLRAIYWYLKAADNGHKDARTWAYSYLDMLIKKEDALRTEKAAEREAAKKAEAERLAAERAEEQRKQREIAASSKCNKNTPELFSTPIDCIRRDTFRATLKSAGNQTIREEEQYFADLYDSSGVLSESKQLSEYYIQNKFAYAEYELPSRLDTKQVGRIAEMVASKYGRVTTSSGSVTMGPVSYQWETEGGITIEVKRGWPSTTTTLSYKHNENFDAMERRMDEIDQANKKQQRDAQSNAF